MVKNRDEVRRDVLDMCGWVQDSYQLPENFFLEQFHKLLKTRHLHMKAMNHDIHSLFCTLYLDISLFLANILLIV